MSSKDHQFYFFSVLTIECQALKNFMCRYVATELASDVVISVGDVKFFLHKVCTILNHLHS